MARPIRNKYYLRSVHEEIGLMDRQLAHLQKYELFGSEKDRAAAIGKLSAKRADLVLSASQMIEEGIEFKESELPRSLRLPAEGSAEEALPQAGEPAAASPLQRKNSKVIAIHEGTALDFHRHLELHTKKLREKRLAAQDAGAPDVAVPQE